MAVNGFDDLCSTDAECAARGSDYADAVCRRGLCERPDEVDPWSCVGKIEYVEPKTSAITVTLRVADPINRLPIAGMTIVPCNAFDVTCASPLSAPVVTDSNGMGVLRVSTEATVTGVFGFSGYFRVTGVGRNSFLSFTAPPLIADSENSLIIGTPETLSLLSPTSTVPVDPTRGHSILTVKNCVGARSRGVRIEFEGGDDTSRVFYAVGVSPNEVAKATDVSGIAFVVNLPPGLFVMRAIEVARNREVARLNVIVQSGFVSLVDLAPTPL